MRLKGGKLFLDLSFDGVENEPHINVDDEIIKTILEKGLVVKLKIGDSFIVKEWIIRSITSLDISGDETNGDIIYNSVPYYFYLDLTAKTFGLLTI